MRAREGPPTGLEVRLERAERVADAVRGHRDPFVTSGDPSFDDEVGGDHESGMIPWALILSCRIIRSDWRGEARNASDPKRAMSTPAVAVLIISMAQQASPNWAGHTELPRPQPTILPSVVVRMLLPSDATSSSTPNRGLPCARCGRGRRAGCP